MTEEHPMKKASLWAAILFCGLLSAYLIFVSAITLWVALTNIDRPGFWAPLLAGALALPVILILCQRIIRRLLHLMREEDVIRR